ncbi:MAG: hypothetical protein ACI8U3_001255 [Brevundimonas sp.]|jgi:hypothetical protein|uniref:hypothetical protein n=1 Tax=Brevundimonas sp. TaxID=1871086 RepID=UPI0039E5F4E5
MHTPAVENSVDNLVGTLRSDEGFRRHFLASPAAALRQRGYDPKAIELPDSADMEALEARLRLLAPAEGEGDVWDGLKELLADPGDTPDFPPMILGPGGPSTAVTIAIAIYGVAIAVGPGNPVTAVVTGGPGPGDDEQQGVNAAADLKTLRALSKSQKEGLTFSVHGPDGLSADNLSRDVLESFLSRLN